MSIISCFFLLILLSLAINDNEFCFIFNNQAIKNANAQY